MHPDYNGSNGFPRWYRSLQLLLIAVVMMASVSPALAVDLSYTFGGDAVWFTQSATTHGGTNAYQSGAVSNSQSSWMETTVTGPGAIRFWWKVSSESCCDPLRFSIDGTSQDDIRGEVGWQSRAFAVPAGSHALRWSYSTDGSVLSGSNAGWVDQISYTPGSNIDVTSPVTSATPAAGIYATSQSVALACVDNAGCTGTYYCLGSNCNPTTPYSGPITVSTAADLRFFSTDAAGNNELVKTASYTFDTTPPVTNSNPGAGTYSGSRYVTLYCGDSGTGCASTYYCLGSGCTPSTLYSSPVQITSASDLRYYSTDRSGNREGIRTSSYIITPDTTPPTTTPSYPSGVYRDPYVYLSCSDGNGSGCAATYYCLGTGCTPSLSFTGFLNISSSTDLRYYSQDNSGNSESVKTVSYIIDTTPPVTSVTPRGGIYSSPQSASLVCSDGSGSGCSATYYCLGKGCSPNVAYNGTISISSSTDLNYYSRDSAYNQELTKSERFTILTAPPATIRVPKDRVTIQEAIDAARDGDTVLVAPGTYMENINFRGKVITVVSSGGADNTIIDGNNTGTVVTFTSGEVRSTVLDGFTIRNGNAGAGGLSNGYGGGIYISYASPTIINNRISANTASWGAGIYEGFGSPLIQGNIITNNVSNSYGGGISIGGAAAAEIVGNIISNNRGVDGGGISMWAAGVPIIKDNTIRDNVASGSGGGITMVNWSDATIIQNVFINNVANTGSAIHWLAPSGSSGPFLANNTIVDASSSQGSVIYADGYDANAILVNNIIAATGNRTAVYCGNLNDINPPKFSNNVVYSRSGDAYGGYCADQNGINGNITSDPQLNSASFGYYGLRAGSPAIDAGDNNVPNLPATDLNGISRSIAGLSQGVARVDVGAYEYDPAEPRATLGNLPGGVTRETSVSITVGGAGIISYRYALDGGPFSTTDTPVATPIVLTGVAGGTHAVAVIGRSLTRLQSVSSATVAEWTIDTAPPVTTVSPAGGSYTAPQAVTLACNDGSGSGCAATFYCLGGGCTPDTPYSGPIAVTSTSGLRYFSRDLFGNQEAIKTASYTFSGTVSGRVTDSGTGNGIQNVNVNVFNVATGLWAGYAYTDSSGAYRISGLPTGNYKLSFSASDYINQWLGGKPNPPVTTSTALPDATNVAVTAPNTTAGINMAMLKGGKIIGTVTDKLTGTALWNVNVSVYDAATGAWAGSGYTDNLGGYSISGLASGGYKIRFSSYSNTGYVAQWYGNKNLQSTATIVNVIAPETVTGINAALEMGAIITGTVTDKVSGAPIQGILVNAVSSDSGMFAGYGYSDSSGAYRVTGLASGNYKLQFSGNGYVSQWFDDKAGQTLATTVSITAPNTVADINVLLTRGGSISGTISDRISGVGIVSVNLSVIDRSSGEWLGGGTSDSNGNYTITGLASGSYSLRIYPAYGSGYLEKWYGGQDGYLCADSVTVTAPNATTGIDALLDMGGSVSGRVTDAVTGAGIPGLRIYLFNIASQSINPYNTAIDATGAYTISGVPGGEYSLYLSAPGYIGSFGSTVVRITAPALLTGVDGTLVKGGGISGRITDSSAGNGVGGVMVRAMDILTRSTLGSTTSDYNGNYTIDGLPNGSYSLYYDGGDVGLGNPARSGLLSRMEAEVSATPVPITAVPTTPYADLTTTTPTPFVPLSRNGFSTQIISVSPIYSATTGTPVPLAHPVSVVAPRITSGVDFYFVRMGSISGRVTDNISGEPINNVFVSAIDNITGTRTVSAFSGSDGIYRISGVPSGTYRVQYSASNSANGGYLSKWYGSNNTPAVPGVVTVLAPEVTTGIDAQLARGGGISGLISVNSCPAPQQVNIRAYDAASGNLVGQAWVSTGYSARFTILALPAGSYILSIIPAETGFVRQWYPNKVEAASAEPITVTSGNITSGINVTLAAGGGSISGKVSGVGGCSLIPASVKLYDWYSGALVADTMTNHDGSFQLAGLPGSSYKLLFTVNQLDRWYRVAGDTAQASPIVVSGGTAVTGINLVEGCSSDLLPLTLMDALRALRVAVGLEPVTQEILTRSDLAPVINGVSRPDGKIDIGDAIAILMKITSVPAVTAP